MYRNSSIFVRISILSALLVIFLAGCGDSPEYKAAKKVRRAMDHAIQTVELEGDYEQARRQVQSGLREGAKGAEAADAGYLTSGNLAAAQAHKLWDRRFAYEKDINSALLELSYYTDKVESLRIEKDGMEKLLAGSAENIEALQELIAGEKGLRKQLQQEQDRLETLQKEKRNLEQTASQMQQSIEQLQTRAQEKIQSADRLSGDAKVDMQKSGYDLMLQNKDPLTKLQQLHDQIERVDVDIAIVEPIVQRIQEQLQAVEKQIQQIRQSSDQAVFREQMTHMQREIEKYRTTALTWLQQIDQSFTNYNDLVSEVLVLLDEAIGDYRKVRSSLIRDQARLATADAQFWSAVVSREWAAYQNQLQTRMASMDNQIDWLATEPLQQKCDTQAREQYTQARTLLEEALEAYPSLQRAAGGEGRCAVLKSQLMAVQQRLALADYFLLAGDSDEEKRAEELFAQFEELTGQIRECDPDFDRSFIGRLLSGQLQYVPSLPVDTATYYEELRKEFQTWKNFEGDERKAEIEKLLARLERIRMENEEEFNKYLASEKQALESELANIEAGGAAPSEDFTPARPRSRRRGRDPNAP